MRILYDLLLYDSISIIDVVLDFILWILLHLEAHIVEWLPYCVTWRSHGPTQGLLTFRALRILAFWINSSRHCKHIYRLLSLLLFRQNVWRLIDIATFWTNDCCSCCLRIYRSIHLPIGATCGWLIENVLLPSRLPRLKLWSNFHGADIAAGEQEIVAEATKTTEAEHVLPYE